MIFDSQKTDAAPGPTGLQPGIAVKVRRIDDPWLRRHSGQVGVVLGIEDGAVEVRFPGGGRQFFLPQEVAALDDQEAARALLRDGPESQVTGAQLKAQRQDAGISQAALARELGVSQTRVGTIERLAIVRPATAADYRSALHSAAASCTTVVAGVQSR